MAMVNLLPAPLLDAEEALARRKRLEDLIDKYLVAGVDYDTPKRGGDDGDDNRSAKKQRKTLLKPGAEKLCDIFGFSSQARTVQRVVEIGRPVPFILYEVEVDIIDQTGRVLATRSGVCSTAELKYQYTWVSESRVFELGLNVADIKVRKTSKSKFGPGDYTTYRIDNPNIADLANTIQAMATKRAFASSTRSATATTGIFDEMDDEAEAEAQAEHQAATRARTTEGAQNSQTQVEKPKTNLPLPTPLNNQASPAVPAQDKPQGGPQPESGKCAECGDEVPKAIKAYSNQHFGKTLCRAHQPQKEAGK